MERRPRTLVALAVAAALYAIPALVMQPAPIPSAGAALGGVLALVLGYGRGWIVTGLLMGAAAGAVVHARMHVAEGRAGEGFAAHVVADAGLGLLIGALVVIGAALASRR